MHPADNLSSLRQKETTTTTKMTMERETERERGRGGTNVTKIILRPLAHGNEANQLGSPEEISQNRIWASKQDKRVREAIKATNGAAAKMMFDHTTLPRQLGIHLATANNFHTVGRSFVRCRGSCWPRLVGGSLLRPRNVFESLMLL